MTDAQHHFPETPGADAGRDLARLHHLSGLIAQMAGRPAPAIDRPIDQALDRNASVSGAYGSMSPVAQRRFDAMVAETLAWAVTGLDALARVKDPRHQPRAAARRLADDLERTLADIAALLRT